MPSYALSQTFDSAACPAAAARRVLAEFDVTAARAAGAAQLGRDFPNAPCVIGQVLRLRRPPG